MVVKIRFALLAAAVLAAGPALAGPPAACPNCPSAQTASTLLAAGEATDQQIEQWIKQLDSDSYDEREKATDELKKAGDQAVKQLGGTAEDGSAEASKRALDVLKHLYHHGDEKAKAAAGKTLKKLSESDSGRIARRAKAAMEDKPKEEEKAQPGGIRLGGQVFRIQIGGAVGPGKGAPRIKTQENEKKKKYSIEDGDQKIEIVENKKTGGIKIKVTEVPAKDDKEKAAEDDDAKKDDTKEEAKPKVTEYEAKDLEELKKKHPEGFKIYEKYTKMAKEGPPQNGGGIRINGQNIQIKGMIIPQQLPNKK